MPKFLAPIALLAVLSTSSHAAPPPPDYRFKVEVLLEDIPQPMEIKMAPDGRIFFNEFRGKLRAYDPATGQVEELGEFETFNGQENGFLGFELDPNFSENHWLYLYYSPTDFKGQHLSRFTLKDGKLDHDSEIVMLKVDEQREQCCHHGGSLKFGPDGVLYVSTGDNTHPHGDSGGHAPIDEREGRMAWNAQKSASNTNSLAGKILRIKPRADGGYDIPEGNLFPKGMEKTRPEIYVMGTRNPWRISVDPRNSNLYWGEVGPDAREDGPRGPRGYDEINQARKAGNFGWPYFIGNNFAYNRYDYETKAVGETFNPAAPLNESKLNTGLKELPAAQSAMIYWPYGKSEEFPELLEGGRTACAGPVFQWKPSFEKTGGFPEYYDGWLLFWDWQRPFIRWAKLDANSDFQGTEAFSNTLVAANSPEKIAKVQDSIDNGSTVLHRPVDGFFGPDGCLYLMDYGETWGANKNSKLIKVSYVRGNLPPLAKASATPVAGREPLKVQLSAAGSKDHEDSAISYEWFLKSLANNESKSVATTPEAEVTLTEPGIFQAELRVTDAQGAIGTASVTLNVGNAPPQVRFTAPQEGDFYTPGELIPYSIEIKDEEDGLSTEKPGNFSASTLVTTALQDVKGREQASDPGLALMKASDCFNCHGIDQKIVGPGFVEIAEKYRGKAGALDTAVERVRAGSTGVWGEVPMLPHPQHTTDEVNIMLRWVFGLEKGKTGASIVRGIEGKITPPAEQSTSLLRLEASFMDGGRAPAPSLTGSASLTLRSRKLEAELAEVNGPKIVGMKIGSIAHGHSIKFPSVPLDQVGSITVRAVSGTAGGTMEFRTGAKDGPMFASITIPNTGGWDKWIERTVSLSGEHKERSDVHVVFVHPGKGGGLMDLDWVQFNAPESKGK